MIIVYLGCVANFDLPVFGCQGESFSDCVDFKKQKTK